MSLATLQQFYDRVEAQLVYDLTLDRRIDADNPATAPELAQRDAKSQIALDDASAVLLAYKDEIASSLWPSADVQTVHCVRVALHFLTGRRVGNDYKAIHDAYDAVIAFYEKLIERTVTLGEAEVTPDAPPHIVTDVNLKGLI